MPKLKFQYFDHLMQRADTLEKTLMLGKTEGRRRRGRQRMRWLDGITSLMDMSLSRQDGEGQGSLVCCSPFACCYLSPGLVLIWKRAAHRSKPQPKVLFTAVLFSYSLYPPRQRAETSPGGTHGSRLILQIKERSLMSHFTSAGYTSRLLLTSAWGHNSSMCISVCLGPHRPWSPAWPAAGESPISRGNIIKGYQMGLCFTGGSVSKESACRAGDAGNMRSIPGLGRSPRRGHGNPLQCSCLQNPMDRRAWRATVHEVVKSWI